MNYFEYKAPKGKVLFDLENFTYGNTVISVTEMNLIVLDKKEAEALSKAYQEEQERLREEERIAEEERIKQEQNGEANQEVQTFKARANNSISTLALNDEGEYEETVEDPLLAFRKDKIIELMAKGVNFNSDNINKEIKSTKYL